MEIIQQIDVTEQALKKEYLRLLTLAKLVPTQVHIHQLRVATRRLNAFWALCYNNGTNQKKRSLRIKKLMKKLNKPRDLQVFNDATYGRFSMQINRQILKKITVWHSAQKNTLKIITDLTQYCHFHPHTNISSITVYWQNTLAQAQYRLQQITITDIKSFHRFRITLKQVRYQLEQLHALGLVANVEDKIAQLKYWQDFLGEVSDGQFAICWLERYHPLDDLLTQIISRQNKFSQQIMKQLPMLKLYLINLSNIVLQQNDNLKASEKNAF